MGDPRGRRRGFGKPPRYRAARASRRNGSEIHLSNCYTSERAFLFVAKDLTQGVAAPDETEQIRVKSVPLRDVLDMIGKGEIYDGLTIIAILQVARLLGI